MLRKLNKAQIAEVKDLYTKNSYGSIKELSKLFNVPETCIMWTVDYKNYREQQTERVKKWNKENPKKLKAIHKRAYDKHKKTDKFKETREKYYKRNKERLRKWRKEHYRKKKLLIT